VSALGQASGTPAGLGRWAKAERDAREKEERRREREAARWHLLAKLRKITSIRRQKVCKLPGKLEDSSVIVRLSHGVAEGRRTRMAGFAGLFSCGNVWTCPCCSAKISTARARELERVMGHFIGQGGYVVLVTLTMRHNSGHRLKQCWDAVGKAWGKVTSGGAWQAEKQAFGVAGWARSVEVTHGWKNGWHVHVHAPIMFHGRPTQDQVAALTDAMFHRWSRALVKSGFDAPDKDNHGLDVQHLDLTVSEGKLFDSVQAIARYVAKGLAMEATLGAQKEAKNGNRTTMQILRDAVTSHRLTLVKDGTSAETLDDSAKQLWEEYERASKGRRQMGWSQSLKELRAELTEGESEKSDEDIAEEDLQGEDVAVLPRLSWDKIAHRAIELKHATEDGGRQGCWDWLNKAGVDWYRPTGLSEHHRPSTMAEWHAKRKAELVAQQRE
jgi:hypothetical protein